MSWTTRHKLILILTFQIIWIDIAFAEKTKWIQVGTPMETRDSFYYAPESIYSRLDLIHVRTLAVYNKTKKKFNSKDILSTKMNLFFNCSKRGQFMVKLEDFECKDAECEAADTQTYGFGENPLVSIPNNESPSAQLFSIICSSPKSAQGK